MVGLEVIDGFVRVAGSMAAVVELVDEIGCGGPILADRKIMHPITWHCVFGVGAGWVERSPHGRGGW